MSNSLISIITPVYNGQDFILKAYQSILTQSYENWEWLPVDDCSNDGSYKILEELSKKDLRVKLLAHKENQGAANARNTAMNKASGLYLAFLDVDDLWDPLKLEASINFMTVSGSNFSYTNYQKIKDGVTGSQIIETPNEITFKDLLKTCSICTSTVVIKKDVVGDIRMASELRRGQDYVFWLQLIEKIGRADRASNKPLTLYSVGHISLSSNKVRKAKLQWMIYRKYCNLNFLQTLYFFLNYAYFGFIKYKKF